MLAFSCRIQYTLKNCVTINKEYFVEETVELIKKVSKKPRSTFINEAVNFYGKVLQKVALKKRLKDGYNKPGE